MKNLDKIIEKFSELEYDKYNYGVSGGLSDTGKMASNRHEDALLDKGKLTFGKAAAMFKKATGCEMSLINEIFNYAVPNPEWHHAGFIPKQYGDGMKKTYFLNSTEIVEIATNWHNLVEMLEISNHEKIIAIEIERKNDQIKHAFLIAHAIKLVRVLVIPEKLFYETYREMNGKYGWFSCYNKTYNMPIHYTGWFFNSQEKYDEFLKLN
jgi:hypothetical protein